MHLNAKPPVFVPAEYRAEIEKISKAGLMDMVWDFAQQMECGSEDEKKVMNQVRSRWAIVRSHRD